MNNSPDESETNQSLHICYILYIRYAAVTALTYIHNIVYPCKNFRRRNTLSVSTVSFIITFLQMTKKPRVLLELTYFLLDVLIISICIF